IGVPEDAGVGALRSAAAAAREQSGRLEALRTVDLARRAAVDEAARARAEQADALAEVAAVELELATLPARREQAQALLLGARGASEAVPALRAQREQLASLRPDVVARGQLTGLLAQLQEEHLAARETALALEVKANDLRVASINTMIAVLAFRLEDGVPCDVCGSPVHPDPSRLRDEGVSVEDEDRARREADTAQAVVASLQERLAAERARAEQLDARVGSWTLAALDEHIAATDLELDVLESTAAQVDAVQADLIDLDQLCSSLAQAQVSAGARADAADRRAVAADQRAHDAARELAAALGEAADLDSALVQAGTVVTVAEAAAVAAEALTSAQAELDRAVVAAESACAAAGFASSEAAVQAARTPSWREEAVASLRSAADLAAAVSAELADPALDVALDPPAPVEATAAALQEADDALAAVLEVLGERRQRRASLERLVPDLEAELTALAPLEEQAREVRVLADLCAGQGANALKMTLTSFVLAARLEEVAAAASVRLLRMSQGRYSLVHTDGAARGGVRSGLGLLARDSWSGQDRDTSTLSGGETFLASLALALGLADVVSAEAGGARIGALFVDEGFGTLDEDTLDEVMDVLDGLREGGRVVGLVSHVAELRQRIPAQLQVRKTRAGSDVVLHGC
ncbi:MAG: SbcC/MukB-like Walker B domain-containing protein, partial [Mycobacteriales bacterium]